MTLRYCASCGCVYKKPQGYPCARVGECDHPLGCYPCIDGQSPANPFGINCRADWGVDAGALVCQVTAPASLVEDPYAWEAREETSSTWSSMSRPAEARERRPYPAPVRRGVRR